MRYLMARTREGGGPEALSTAPQVAPVALADEGGVPVGYFYAGEAIEGKTGLRPTSSVGAVQAGSTVVSNPRGTSSPVSSYRSP